MSGCDTYMELISQCLDGELSEPQKTELDAHLAICSDCRRLYDAFAALSSSIDEDAEPPETLRADVMDAIRAQNTTGVSARKHSFGWGRLGALAACLAIVVFAASKADLLFKGAGSAAPSALGVASTSVQSGADVSPEDFAVSEVDIGNEYERTADDEEAVIEPAPSPAPPSDTQNTAAPETHMPPSGPANSPAYGDEGKHLNSTGGAANGLPHEDIRVTSGSGTTVSLMEVSAVTLFSGESPAQESSEAREPVAILSDEESILLIMEMLEFSEDGGSTLTVSGTPTFVVDVKCLREADSYTLSVWVVEGRLCCISSLDEKLYVAAGTISDLIEFVANA